MKFHDETINGLPREFVHTTLYQTERFLEVIHMFLVDRHVDLHENPMMANFDLYEQQMNSSLIII